MIIKAYYCFQKDNYEVRPISIEYGTTIGDFLKNILKFNLKTDVGIYGKIVNETYIIKDNDRIEIYEKILVDPKIRRRKRASDEKC